MTEADTSDRRFLARRPVFDVYRDIVGYELLLEGLEGDSASAVDGNRAAAELMQAGLSTANLMRLTDGQPVFINVNREVLENELAGLFPPKLTVVSLLGDVDLSEDVRRWCAKLGTAGYRIALEAADAERAKQGEGWVHIVRADCRRATSEALAAIAQAVDAKHVVLLATSVDGYEDFRRARAAGYQLFQGYFFAEPEIVDQKGLAPGALKRVELLRALHTPQLDIDELEAIIKSDVALTYRLLRYVNSARFSLRTKVDSIGFALRLLGTAKVRVWASIVTLDSLGEKKPNELVVLGLMRARFCELLADQTGLGEYEEELFLLGLLSVVPGLVDAPLDDVVQGLSLSPALQHALLESKGPMGQVLDLVCHYERAGWDRVGALLVALRLDRSKLANDYVEALTWAMDHIPKSTD